MKPRALLTLSTLPFAPRAVLPAAAPPVVSWTPDKTREAGAVQPARERLGPEGWKEYGCSEQMSDKRTPYAPVRILEQADARGRMVLGGLRVHW